MASRYKQGYFTPKNPAKYMGDPSKIVYRSSWELSMNNFLDNNTRVVKWGSEIIAIPYIKPTDNKLHKYYPDYYVEYVNTDGEIMKEIIEVKPLQQTKMPKSNHKHRLYEQLTFAINSAKWAACQDWCTKQGIKFRIVTEQSLFK